MSVSLTRSTSASKTVVIRDATPMHLFNIPITELPLVIDVRSSASYRADHVQGAINFNSDIYSEREGEEGVRDVDEFIGAKLRSYFEDDYPDNLSSICIYSETDADSTTSSSTTLIDVLVDFLSKFGLPYGRLDMWRKPDNILFISSFNRIASEFPYMITRNASGERFGADCPIGNVGDLFFPSMICPWGLFLGSKNNANNIKVLQQLSISLIINITVEEPNFFENTEEGSGISYLKLSCVDDDSQDMLHIWEEADKAIKEARQKQMRVLIHCHAGKSRSASTVIYYLINSERMLLTEALSHCQQCRQVVQPNLGFMKQLSEFQASATNAGEADGNYNSVRRRLDGDGDGSSSVPVTGLTVFPFPSKE